MWDIMTVAISGGLLVLFSVLFGIEAKRGQRVLLRGARSWLDQLVLRVFYFVSQLRVHFGAGSILMFLHYCIHKVLAGGIATLTAAEHSLERWQRQNRSVAKHVRAEQEKTHLDVIAEHKASVTLTETEKRKLKEKSMAG